MKEVNELLDPRARARTCMTRVQSRKLRLSSVDISVKTEILRTFTKVSAAGGPLLPRLRPSDLAIHISTQRGNPNFIEYFLICVCVSLVFGVRLLGRSGACAGFKDQVVLAYYVFDGQRLVLVEACLK